MTRKQKHALKALCRQKRVMSCAYMYRAPPSGGGRQGKGTGTDLQLRYLHTDARFEAARKCAGAVPARSSSANRGSQFFNVTSTPIIWAHSWIVNSPRW